MTRSGIVSQVFLGVSERGHQGASDFVRTLIVAVCNSCHMQSVPLDMGRGLSK